MSIRERATVLYRCFLVSAFATAASISNVGHASPLAIGTVEKFDSRTSLIVVLGQRFSVGSAKLVAGTKSYAAAQGVGLLAPGALVWVDGEFNSDGTTNVASLTVLPEANTPGATQLFVAGIVKAVDRTGKVKIGGLTIDTTPTLGSLNRPIRVGDALEILGVQPAPNGVLVADALAPLRTQGIGGMGTSGIGGTGVSGIGGTGVSGIGGTGVSGIGGTGVSGIGGTGVSGIGGTGVSGIGGTGVSGIGGTGVSGIGGTGVSGIGGTGVSGIGGTGVSGIGGTGVSGIGGTGVN